MSNKETCQRVQPGTCPSCVEVERLPLLIAVQDVSEISVSVENASPQQWVCRLARESLESATAARVGNA